MDDEDDDEYEPFLPTEDNEQILNKLDGFASKVAVTSDISLPPFKIDQPSPLTSHEAGRLGEIMADRLLSLSNTTSRPSRSQKEAIHGLNRLAMSGHGSESWRSVLMRIMARTEDESANLTAVNNSQPKHPLNITPLSNGIRNMLFSYVMDDFRSRMITAFDWLNEEWYNDRLQSGRDGLRREYYQHWTLKILGAIFPYVDSRDKNLLIRFLSEIPELNTSILDKFIDLARDPERIVTVVQAL